MKSLLISLAVLTAMQAPVVLAAGDDATTPDQTTTTTTTKTESHHVHKQWSPEEKKAWHAEHRQHLYEKLGLSEKQKAEMDKIIASHRQEDEKFHKQMMSILTPEQRQKFEAMKENHRHHEHAMEESKHS